MTPASQLVWRNRHRLSTNTPPLFLLAEADDLALELRGEDINPSLHTQLWSAYNHFERQGFDADFGPVPVRCKDATQFVLFQPREKQLLNMMLDWVQGAMSEESELYLVGENLAGIKSAGKRLVDRFAESRKLDAARHCSLFQARGPLAHDAFDIGRYISADHVEIDNARLPVMSLPGVFAHGRIDEGTALLIRALTRDPWRGELNGHVLDFACGSGAMGLALLHCQPALDLTMLDNASLALESAARTMRANGFEACIMGSDGLESLLAVDQAQAFDWIVSNPPFHAGARQQLDVARRFIAESASILKPSGRLVLVANVHLPYKRWLKESYGIVDIIAENGAYNVWMATGPRAS